MDPDGPDLRSAALRGLGVHMEEVERAGQRTLGTAPPDRAPLGCAQLTLVPGYQANSGSGGALAGAIGGGELGSLRWSRILRTTSLSVIVAINRRAPPQSGQVRTSTANTRAL
jgi:hypothetical protein